MILMVEDDSDLADLISMHLSFQGHDVMRTVTLKEAQQLLTQTAFDLLVLDRGLTDGDGLTLCQQVRSAHFTLQDPWLPVLFLTARDTERDKVDGLESGADDYLTKPFSVLEFQARVRSLLRRQYAQQQRTSTQPETESSSERTPTDSSHSTKTREAPLSSEEDDVLIFDGLIITPERHHVALNQQTIPLTATEFTLLHFMAQRPGRVYSKDELLQQVWQTDFAGYHHTVCSTINRLRTKLAPTGHDHKYIHTVWGVGYKFEA
ncbi:response regulator transcription factor [Photobacterium aphoticum]|uniref:Phosphate regulon transcriptional regulatory protein PhoB n=1 Tax=Photobacterium aphoticum TaxID=754436 RepID=A0A0J1GRX4_9GAMM|nr:response regulator transcription factor [Photobacterium aphoticum]KLV02495.1 transcriptional regulator [Photobacterium aphoticum]PSU56939.1 DNA-binding response regulator [Photobacterium aphoticum]GHA64688.1 DNA-binding response regulator [Photobacterium aphoticum]